MKKTLLSLTLMMAFISGVVYANSEDFFSISLINIRTGLKDEIILSKRKKNIWTAERIILGKELITKKIKEKDYLMMKIRLNMFLKKLKKQKILPGCIELFEIKQKGNNEIIQTFRGCISDYKEAFPQLFLHFLSF